MSEPFVIALFVAILLVIFWRVALVALLAFVLATLLMGLGAVGDSITDSADGPTSEVRGGTPAEPDDVADAPPG